MVLDNTAPSPHELARSASESLYLLPSLLYCMDKREKKLLKLNTKAQECVSRKKAQKILKKHEKATITQNR